MAELTVQSITDSGLNPSYAAADAAGDSFESNGTSTFFHVKNGDASAHTVTVASQVTDPPAGTAADDLAVSVPAGEERMIGPFPRSAYHDANGLVQATYDAVTGMTVAAISF